MAYGRLGVAELVANTLTTIYTVPAKCRYAELTIDILNPNTDDSGCSLAVANSGTPANNEYLESGAVIPANGGSLQRDGIIASPGERVVVETTLGATVVRVSGKEIL